MGSLDILIFKIIIYFTGKVFKVWTNFQQMSAFLKPLWIQATHRTESRME